MSANDTLPGETAPASTGADIGGPATRVRFDTPDLLDRLATASPDELDRLAFGVIGMAPDGTVESYNVAESKLSGLTPERVIGRNFFTSVAPCTNNFMVAFRFESEPVIDATIDYVFTFRMAPQKVRLRLLRRPDTRRMYLVVEKRD
jgi:photoactive yellow protein